ncbi:MAG: hypothetical protein ACT4PO_06000 [Actinomycetota bacterium]
MAGSAKRSHANARTGPGAGPVMLIGGAEDKSKKKVILTRFAELAGGEDGHIVLVSTASTLGDQATDFYRELFLGLGVGEHLLTRPSPREHRVEQRRDLVP